MKIDFGFKDHVRKNTPDATQRKIDKEIASNIAYYRTENYESIRKRINDLDAKWDIERALELNASTIALASVVLGATINRKWLWLSGLVCSFLAQHAIQGWCPPLPLFRKMGLRTRKELDKERYALIDVLRERKVAYN